MSDRSGGARVLARWVVFLVAASAIPFVPAAAQSGEPWSINDEPNDQAYSGNGPTDAVPEVGKGLVAPHVDIRKVEILDEDESGLAFEITVAGVESSRTRSDAWCWGGSIGFGPAQTATLEMLIVTFKIGDRPMRINGFYQGSWSNDRQTFHANGMSACLSPQSMCGSRGCASIRIDASIDSAAEKVRFFVTKDALTGLAPDRDVPFAGGWAQNLTKGGVITEIVVASESTPVPFANFAQVRLTDRAPATGFAPDYKLVKGVANGGVRAKLDGGSTLPVQANLNQSLGFSIQNVAAGRRILTFEYLLDGEPEVLGNYQVFGPPTVSVPSGETRSFHLALNVGPGAKDTDNVTLKVKGRSAGFADELAYDYALLVPSPPLHPGANTLYLHTIVNPDPSCLGAGPFAFASQRFCWNSYFTPLRDEPTAPADGNRPVPLQVSPGGSVHTGDGFYLPGRGGSPSPLLLDLTKKVEVDLATDAPGDIDGLTVTASIGMRNLTGGSPPFQSAAITEPVSFPAGEGKVTLKLPLKSKLALLPQGTNIGLYLNIQGDASPGAVQAYADRSFVLRPKDTQIRLPLVELPEELRVRLVQSPFQVGVVGDREDFINPGESFLFNLTLLNQAGESATARLGGRIGVDGWRLEFRPDDEYKLAAGDTIRVSVLVFAPLEAVEGQRVPFNITVTDPQLHEIVVPLALIVTTQIDLPDAEEHLVVDEEAVTAAEKANPPANKSPAPAFAALLAYGAAAALARRRR